MFATADFLCEQFRIREFVRPNGSTDEFFDALLKHFPRCFENAAEQFELRNSFFACHRFDIATIRKVRDAGRTRLFILALGLANVTVSHDFPCVLLSIVMFRSRIAGNGKRDPFRSFPTQAPRG